MVECLGGNEIIKGGNERERGRERDSFEIAVITVKHVAETFSITQNLPCSFTELSK